LIFHNPAGIPPVSPNSLPSGPVGDLAPTAAQLEDPMAIRTLLEKHGRGVITIESSRTVGEAIWMLRLAGASALMVSDNRSDILGLVGGHDLIRALKRHGVDPLMPMTVADIMQTDVAICHPDDSLRCVMARMTGRGLGHIAVVDDSGPCGVVSLADVIKGRLQWAKAQANAMCGTAALPA
jgi:CBS domain-containing protein